MIANNKNNNTQVEIQPADNVIEAVATNSTKSQPTNSMTAPAATTTFVPPALTATATFLPPHPTTTTATTANPLDLETSSNSDISLTDHLKTDFNLVVIDERGNPTGVCGGPWAKLNAKDEIQPLARNLGTIGHGKLTRKTLALSVIKAHNEEDICNEAPTSMVPRKSKDCPF